MHKGKRATPTEAAKYFARQKPENEFDQKYSYKKLCCNNKKDSPAFTQMQKTSFLKASDLSKMMIFMEFTNNLHK